MWVKSRSVEVWVCEALGNERLEDEDDGSEMRYVYLRLLKMDNWVSKYIRRC